MKKYTMVCVVAMILLAVQFVPVYVLAQQQTPLKQVDIGEQLFDLAWSPDGQLLAVGSKTGLKILDANLEPVTELQGHIGAVTSVAWSPDGTQLASGGGIADSTIRIWDYDKATGIFTFQRTILTYPTTLIFLLAYSPDGTKLASLAVLNPAVTHNDDRIGQVLVRDTTTWEPTSEWPYEIQGPIRTLSWNSDSGALVVAGRYGVGVFDAQSSKSLYFLSEYSTPTVAQWLAENRLIYVVNGWTLMDGLTNQLISYWNYPFGAIRMDVNADGSRLIASGHMLRVLDISTGAVIATFNVASSYALDWNSDSSIVATGSSDGIIQLWDTSNLPDVSGTPTVTPFQTATLVISATPT